MCLFTEVDGNASGTCIIQYSVMKYMYVDPELQIHISTLHGFTSTKCVYIQERRLLTNEVIWAEEVVVPDLQCEARVHVHLRLAQTVEVLLLLDDYHLLRWKVLEWEHKAPVEVTLSVHGAVVHVRLLSIVLSTNPAVCVLCEGVYV